MWDSSGWLEQQQASSGIAGNNSTAKSGTSQSQVVPLVVVTSQRKLKSILPGGGAVAGAGTAAVSGKQRLNIVPKRPVSLRFGMQVEAYEKQKTKR